MKIIEPGHIYQLHHLDGSGAGFLVFVNREDGLEHEGTQTQEVLRALIDRTQHCDGCLRWDGNDKIIHHLRMALALHEGRALERKTEKGELHPEKVATGPDGHFSMHWKCKTLHAPDAPCPVAATAEDRADALRVSHAEYQQATQAPQAQIGDCYVLSGQTLTVTRVEGTEPDSLVVFDDNTHTYQKALALIGKRVERAAPTCRAGCLCEECRVRGVHR